MNLQFFEQLAAEGIVEPSTVDKVREIEKNPRISLHWDLRTLLYLGILMLTTGLGIIVYKNIDHISHIAVLGFIAAVSIACFMYCFRKASPWSRDKVHPPNTFFDYVLLLGCLCLLIFLAYAQFKFHIFGTQYGMATAVPMALLFFCAYYFDHLGVLTMAITNFAAWVGIVATPAQLLAENNFNSSSIIITGVLLGLVLLGAAELSRRFNFKNYFAFTYSNVGMHVLYIFLMSALFHFDHTYLLWFVAIAVTSFYFYQQAKQRSSFYLMLVMSFYSYVAVGYAFVRLVFFTLFGDTAGYELGLMYFIGSGVCLIIFLVRQNKNLRSS